jgi:hypothetical protein
MVSSSNRTSLHRAAALLGAAAVVRISKQWGLEYSSNGDWRFGV